MPFSNSSRLDPVYRTEISFNQRLTSAIMSLDREYERLSKIFHLGHTSVTFPTATHTKLDHQYGLNYLILKRISDDYLPKDFLDSIHAATLAAHVGHLPYSHCSQKAVLMAAQLSETFRDDLRNMLGNIASCYGKCSTCVANCGARDFEDVEKRIDQLMSDQDWQHLQRWFGTYKLINNRQLLGILNDSFYKEEAIKTMIEPECKWHHFLDHVDMTDYIMRDSFYTTTIQVYFDIDKLLEDIFDQEDSPEWQLLHECNRFLQARVYLSPDVEVKSSIIQKMVCNGLLNQKISVGDLLSIDKGTDENLRRLLARDSDSRVFGQDDQFSWCRDIGLLIEDKDSLELESYVSGYKKGILNYHKKRGFLIVPRENDKSILICARHADKGDPSFSLFLSKIKKLYSQYPYTSVSALRNAVYEYLFLKGIEIAETELLSLLSKALVCKHDNAQKIAEKLAQPIPERSASTKVEPLRFGMMVGDETIPIGQFGSILSAFDRLMVELIKSSDIEDRMDGIDGLLSKIALYPYYRFKKPTTIDRGLMSDARKILKKLLFEETIDGNIKGKALEAIAYIDAILDASETSCAFWLVDNGVTVLDDSNTILGEIDVTEIKLLNERFAEVHLWSCAIYPDASKRTDDMRKKQEFAEMIRRRFVNSIQVTIENTYELQADNIIITKRGNQTVETR